MNTKMRSVQIALEKKNMKQTSMKGFMKTLEKKQTCEVFVDIAQKVESGIQKFHDDAQRKRSPFFKMTEDLSHETLAFIGVKCLFGTLSMSSSMAATTLASNIGDAILSATSREEMIYNVDEKTIKDKVTAGLILIRIIVAALGSKMFRINLERLDKTNSVYMVSSGKELKELIEEHSDIFVHFSKKMMPLVCEPDDWEDVLGGGYLLDSSKKLAPLIKRHVKHDVPEGNLVYDAINHLQKTPFRVNRRILDVVLKLQELKPLAFSKVFSEDKGTFSLDCPLKKGVDDYLWDREDVEVPTKSGKKVKIVSKLKHQDEESQFKRREFFKWADKKDLHRSEAEARISLMRSFETCVEITEVVSQYSDIFWAYCLDRRSRVYPTAMTGINIQGADYQKAVVEFSVGLPLDFDGDGEGGEFAIIKTICNHWGKDSGNGVKTDKLTRSACRKWLKSEEDWILDCVEDPLNNQKWMAADKPLQFLAAAMEWSEYLKYRETHDDYKFVSRLCDPNDASCSGAQILSAMTKDEVGCFHTNLMNRDVQDLYMAVAKKVTENLMNVWESDGLAQDWLGRQNILDAILRVCNGESDEVLGDESVRLIQELSETGKSCEDIFDEVYKKLSDVERLRYSLIIRDLVKKPVMVKFYSGTRYGNIEHCSAFIVKKGWEDFFRCDGTGKAASYMGNLIYDSINQVISGAGKVMEWFIHVADVFGNLDLPVKWTTLVGFKASLKKLAMKNLRINVPFTGDKLNKIQVKVPKYEVLEDGTVHQYLDTAKMKSGIAPDIVHSLDASLIMSVAERCKREGINHLLMIHDSLGSHCCFSKRFNRIIREQFIELFSQDVLGNLYEEFKSQLPVDQQNLLLSPEQFGIVYGNFDLKEMLDSFFCFK